MKDFLSGTMHHDIEMYNGRSNHLESLDHTTGKIYKEPVSDSTL